MNIKQKAHKYLINKGCLSVGQTYTAFQVENMLPEFVQEEQLGWINLNDKLPEVSVSVLLLTDVGIIEGKLNDKKEWSFICLDYHGCGCCAGNADIVTHWMPIPTLPTPPAPAQQ